jgi:hypothetical protein
MRVTIRLRRGRRLATKGGHDPRRRAARQLSTWFTQAAIFGYAMTIWKYGYDLGRVKEFAVEGGLFSHWQAWGALSVGSQLLGVPLRHFSESKAASAPQRVTPAAPPPKRPVASVPRPPTRPVFSVPSSRRPPQPQPARATLYRAG